MPSASEYIKKLQEEFGRAANRLARLDTLRQRYPDLRVRERDDGWVKFVFARSVNAKVTNIEIAHCPHCEHSPCVVRPYYFDPDADEKVYSDPPSFVIGHRPTGGEVYGEIEEPLWRERMTSAGISPAIFPIVQKFLANHPPVSEESP
jgi:hypothetical protein